MFQSLGSKLIDMIDYLKSSGKTENQVFSLPADNSGITIPEPAETFGITARAIEKQIVKLREKGRLRRIGPDLSGAGAGKQFIDRHINNFTALSVVGVIIRLPPAGLVPNFKIG